MMSEELETPGGSNYLNAKKSQAKDKIFQVFDEYKELVNDKTHPDNHTPAYNQKVIKTLQRLLTAADELDSVLPGEGIFGLIGLALRTSLKVKDQNIVLEKEIRDLKLEVKRLKKR
jgi:hypothetical protein